MNRGLKALFSATEGAVQVEQMVLVASVAIAFAAGVMVLCKMLFSYHQAIEFTLSLPIP